MTINTIMKEDISKSTAIKFVILFGFISLFADMTYEGARSTFPRHASYRHRMGIRDTRSL